MGKTLAATIAAHRAGKSPVETVEATYARIAAHDDPRFVHNASAEA